MRLGRKAGVIGGFQSNRPFAPNVQTKNKLLRKGAGRARPENNAIEEACVNSIVDHMKDEKGQRAQAIMLRRREVNDFVRAYDLEHSVDVCLLTQVVQTTMRRENKMPAPAQFLYDVTPKETMSACDEYHYAPLKYDAIEFAMYCTPVISIPW